jgi:hypothetical protein
MNNSAVDTVAAAAEVRICTKCVESSLKVGRQSRSTVLPPEIDGKCQTSERHSGCESRKARRGGCRHGSVLKNDRCGDGTASNVQPRRGYDELSTLSTVATTTPTNQHVVSHVVGLKEAEEEQEGGFISGDLVLTTHEDDSHLLTCSRTELDALLMSGGVLATIVEKLQVPNARARRS